ncbi:unnamed protein product [Symbiodinium natans]|uniref:Rhodanese domain-containing protein n=1 Tax=Symbiodinium natans TaxID=878477 RepID=A0A812PER5_9DINO|nr:unnamed protein product [Symbiodinium natans]
MATASGDAVDVEALKATEAAPEENVEEFQQAVGVGVLGWLGFIIVNLAAWGFITFASFVSWTFGLGVCILYTVLLVGLAFWLERMTTTAAGPERGQPGVVRPALDGGEAHGAQPEAVRPDGALEAGGTGVAGSVDGAMVSGDSMDSGHGTSGQVARVQALALASGAVVAGGMQAVVASTSMTREVEPAGEAGDMGMLRDGLNSGGHQQPGGFSWNAQGSPMGREAQPRGAMPTWVSRLGAFFQAMGQSQQVTPPEWMPSPFPSPMTRPSRSQRALESPMSHGERDEASRTPLFDDEQRQQMRAMEQRAPLLYGATGVGPRPVDGGGSSGGSTYEAVKEEVRQQLQGCNWSENAWEKGSGHMQQGLVLGRDGANTCGMVWWGPCRVRRANLGHEAILVRYIQFSKELSPNLKAILVRYLQFSKELSPNLKAILVRYLQFNKELPPNLEAILVRYLGAILVRYLVVFPPNLEAILVRYLEVKSSRWSIHEVHHKFWEGTLVNQEVLCKQDNRPLGHLQKRRRGREEKGNSRQLVLEVTEDVHKPVGDIPMLPALSDRASVDFGDWLHCLEHAMGDLSTSSAEWWQEVKDCAKAYYDSYQKADHFNRLNLAPLASPVLQEARWQRVDRRAATLLLASTPEDIRRELVASRVRSSLEILSRLMVLYRPGSVMAVDGLRLWWRYFQRAKDLGVVIPDPSVLLRGIDVLVKKPLLDHHEVAFRMNLVRYQLKVDFVPVEDNVKAVHKALLAEFEQLASRKPKGVPGNNSPSTTPLSPQAKPMQPETQRMIKADDVATVISEASTMTSSPMATRTTLDDPIPGTPMDMQQMLENAQRMVKSLMEHSATMKVMRITSAESEEVRRAQALGTLPAVSKMGLLDSGATHALRPGTVEEKKKAAKVEVALAGDTKIELPQSDKGTILGDNQAQPIVPLGTLVRQLGYEFVWNARGCRLRHPSRPEVQVYTRSSCPEVRECDALRLIAELEGTKADEALRTMQELETSIKVARSHEGRNWADFLKGYVVTGDPSDGLRAVLSAEFMSDVPFEDKIRIFEKIPQSNEEAWKLMKSLPLNRARRRSLWASRRWIVHLFSGKGESSDPIKTLTGCRVQGPRGETREASMAEVLEIDLTQSKSWDIATNGGIFALLLWAASQGKIHAIVGGPPCRTFSLLRHRELQGRNNAPRPVRSAQHLWGLPGQLTRDEEALVRGDNNLILRMVWLWLVAEAGLDMCYPRRDRGPAVAFGMEHPDDPREFLQPGAVSNEIMEKCASFWRTKLVEHMKNNGMHMYRFDQGALGHPQKKPTGLLTTMELDEISGLKDTRREWPEPENSKDMASWAPGLREALAKGIRRWAWRGEISVAMNTFTPKQLEEWRRHVEAGHWPFRRDCSVCLSAAGTGRPARRVLHRDAYVLSLDIGGAFAEKGIDERNDNGRANKYKFVLAATYVFPKAFDVVSKDMPIPDDIDEYLGQEEVDEEGPEPEAAEEEVERKEDKDHEEEWKRLVGDLNKPQEFQVLRFAVPLAKHKGADILAAVQDLYIYLRANGFPLARIHSDRAREFRTKQLRKWCRERDIYQTYTEGLAPTQNAMAENQVKWLKARARVLLTASGLNKKYWPCAMKHACAAHNTRQLGKTMTPIQFGSQVMVKTKKDVGPFDPRWEEAVYLGPADDVREGHVLELADGTWHRTLHMRVVRDDEVPSGGDEPWVADRVDPGRRVRGKRRLEDPDGSGVRVLQEGQEDGEEEIAEQRAHDKLEYNKYEDEDALEIVRALRLTSGPKRRGTQDFDWCGSWSTGAYVHGGVWGVQTNTTKFPKVTRFLTTFLRNKMKEPMPFGTIVVNVNQELLPHRDLRNEREFANSVYGMGDFSGGEVWEQTYLEENTALDVYRATTKGLVRGRTMDVKGKIQALWAHRWHATMPWTGTRVTVVGYVPRKFKNVGSENYNLLRDMGFMVPVGADEEEEDDVQEPQQKVLQGNDIEKGGGWNESVHVPGGHVELGVHWTMKFVREGDGGEGELRATPTFPVQDHVRERVQERLLWARELLEEEREIWERQERQTGIVDEHVKTVIDNLEETVAYMELYLMQEAVTQNVEQLLQGLEGPLEVVHNVSLQEVREHLTDWVPSMKKEVATLETSGTLRPIPLSQAKRQSEAGELILVPGKTVFTVKPPEDVRQSKYKRKTRFVICGSFVKDGDTTELYTANAKAESVRCSLATAASRNWEAAGTDINSAFTLTPMTESATQYAVTAPKILVEAGVVPPGTAYKVDRVLYGLREAPRLWGIFRDRRIRNARLTVDGRDMKFTQLETDESVWRLHPVDDPQETIAMMVVYVDDVLFLGKRAHIEEMYSWLVNGTEEEGAGWKCSPLEFVGKDPVRYLGMEIRSKMKDGGIAYHVCQGGYIGDLLREHGVEAWTPSLVPATREAMPQVPEPEDGAEEAEPDPSAVHAAQKLAGELLWLSMRTRPDVSFAVAHVCSAATRCPEAALKLGRMVLRYLRDTVDLGLTYDGTGPTVLAYSDASYAPGGGRSFGCAATMLHGGFVAWRMARQPVISLSVAEAELYEVINAYQQAMSIKEWIKEIHPKVDVTMLIDNLAALGLASSSPGSWKTRHLRIRARFLRQETASGRLELKHSPGEVQAADMGTKAVPAPRLRDLRFLWKMTVGEFLEGPKEVILNGVKVPESEVRFNQMRIMMMLVVCALVKGTQGAELPQEPKKDPLPYDAGIEFYGLMVLCGVAMIGIWEVMKWCLGRCCGSDEATVRRARRLLRIRDQTTRALQEELMGLRAEEVQSSPPVSQGSPVAMSSSSSATAPTTRLVENVEPARTTTAVAEETQVGQVPDPPRTRQSPEYDFELFTGVFYKSERGEKVHLFHCRGMREVRSRVTEYQVCSFCLERYPLYYRRPFNDALLRRHDGH